MADSGNFSAPSSAVCADIAENVAAGSPLDPELAAVIESWDSLPAAIKAGIVAMVKAAS